MTTDGSEVSAGSLLSSVFELSALVMSLNGADDALVSPLRRFVLYLHKMVQSMRVLSHAPVLSLLDIYVGHSFQILRSPWCYQYTSTIKCF